MLISREKGFTLIELLVVIAIIGILSSVVLASLNSARNKANDSKTKAQLATIRAAAEIYYDNNNSRYNTLGVAVNACTTVGSIFRDTSSGMANLTTATNYPSGVTLVCFANAAGSAYAVSASLPSAPTTNFWCVDSTGRSASTSAQATTSVCP